MIQKYLILSAVLFGIGLFGVLSRRNVMILLMSIELMLNSVNITLAAFARQRGDASGQVMILMIMVVAAVEVAIGLSLLIVIFRNKKSVDSADFTSLKE